MNRALLPSLFLAVAIPSCSDEPPVRPGIFSGDATISFSDMGPIDIPTPDRAPEDRPTVTTDVSGATDTGSSTDAASSTDTGSTSDLGTAADLGTATDAGTTTDAGTATDAGTTTDAGTATDAGVAVDTGTATDAGTVADTGTATDTGSCGAGVTACSEGDAGATVCVDLRVSTLHCGACGVRCCRATDRCVAGVCTSNCPTLQTSCRVPPGDAGCVESRCVDTNVDDLNCGACGRACAEGKGCVSGRCL